MEYVNGKGGEIIKEEKGEKEFGNEKNKLVITQTGIFVIEFLIKYFDKIFINPARQIISI